ncbi:Dual specificity tyrosine-phosphorylation-regulated kinase 3 [Tritrichomonas foetus]|uniref:dual-specificity kinase n=1 Tax=Tritrichomonas foetus TaxID=1144522 RepID=A0A1J4KUK8_9EUKA|nr:Dual specificity tyrosine-phosphorylation-regulated kinase 3 [Tritrichomonas foetus]|eukprot:OHT14955.1 Dual specificity tyrosine-phosphorylation-regulated kinase 3 [Tritrichomonas foetus]
MQNSVNKRRKPLVPQHREVISSRTTHTITSPHPPRSKSTSRPTSSRAVVSGSSISPTVIRGPISPDEALCQYSPVLTQYEKKEIFKFKEIYYLGKLTKKINNKGISTGWDTPSHHYNAQVGDHINYRFEIRSLLGKGAFGQVLRCYDHKTQKHIAVKIIINTPQMMKQGEREIEILKKLVSSENNYIIQLLDNFTFRNHLCAVFEVLGQNLYDYSKSMRFRPMPAPQVQTIAREVLVALNFCHSKKICHCDLKPENIMFNSGSTKDIQLIDYGSSCYVGDPHFDYIQSRYYRAPEVILGMNYGTPMDMWSFAGIVVELLTGKPLFAGSNESEQMAKYVELLGNPPREMIVNGKQSLKYFTEAGVIRPVRGKKRIAPKSVTIQSLTNIKNAGIVDLLMKCLVWDQTKRITASEALNHPWITQAAPGSAPKKA